MKRKFRTILSITLCLMTVLGNVAVGGEGFAEVLEAFSVKASATTITSYSQGDIIEFGWYPQTKETDSAVISALNELGGDNTAWTSYNYYIGTGKESDGQMTPSDFMRYTDVMYGNAKYRGVVFDFYRPRYTGYNSSNDQQSSNSYSVGTVYWFKYEPIKWRILDPSTGLVLSETILDSQAFNNYLLYADNKYWGDSSKAYYANNYANSSIRQWLNNDFYNTAFSAKQQNIIQSTKLDNCAFSTSYSAYDSVSTTDKIFLLSYSDAYNSSYGFGSNSARIAQGSDYSKCQGLYSGNENSYWRLRSAGYTSGNTSTVDRDGDGDGYIFGINDTYIGVRAAFKLSLTSDIFQSLVSVIGKGTESGYNGKITALHTRDIFEFGWYPQVNEIDSTIISELNELGGDNKDWTSYNYYTGTGNADDGQMNQSNYMRYTDVMYGTAKYRGVVFDSYRPFSTGETSSNNYQSLNGYSAGTTYWFKYEPIKWRVLDPSTGLVFTETILDSQPYNNYILSNGTDEYGDYTYWGDSAKTYYANNYAYSSIRQWLNNDFYNTAFSTDQQNIIQSTKLDNSALSTSYSAYDSASTTDKIFLLSLSEVNNISYGLIAISSDYAKCQGIYVYSGIKNSYWILRSAGLSSRYTCGVIEQNSLFNYEYNASFTFAGVRPALKLNPTSDIFQSLVSETGKGNNNGCGPMSDVKETEVIKGNAYDRQKTYAYKTAVTFNANVPEGCSAEWFVDGKSVGNGESFTVSDATKSYTVKVIVTDKDGNTSFDTETVTIKNSFWDKISYFFKHLFNPSAFIVNQQ